MGLNLSVKGYVYKNIEEYKKHLEALEFCSERNLSLPYETEQFLRQFSDEEYIKHSDLQSSINLYEDGIEIDLPIEKIHYQLYQLKVSDIPKDVSILKIRIDNYE